MDALNEGNFPAESPEPNMPAAREFPCRGALAVIVRMHLPHSILFLICAVFMAQGAEQTPLLDDPGVTNNKAFYPDGTLKLLTRRRLADGLLLAKWHYGTNGVVLRVDDYDKTGRVLRTLVKWHDGSSVDSWFDEQHRLWRENRFDPPLTAGIIFDSDVFLLRGDITLHPSQRWSGSTHKLNDSQDMVAFNVVSDNASHAIITVTAYDLTQPTNRVALSSLNTIAQHSATETSHIAGWSVHVFREKRSEIQAEVRDCFLSSTKRFGLHVRLTIPASLTLTRDQKTFMEQEFKGFLETVEARETK
jgi:hypothetical protein